jgi:N-acetylglucosaminyldiphosphoundecaprenol N-acetyl-beta-D-mannosaminyltransferase
VSEGASRPTPHVVERVRETTPVRRDDELRRRHILGMRVDATSYDDAAERVCRWAHSGESRYVCVATVNNVIEALDHDDFRDVMNGADLVTPDGMPLVWGLRLLGIDDASRVYGPVLMPGLCARASEQGIPVGFYGGTADVLDSLIGNLQQRFPALDVTYRHSPPFRALTAVEEARVLKEIELSGARILFVGLGAPKQEQWMARHRGRLYAVTVGVGAAFDFIANRKRQAPAWIQRLGLEWLFRLVHEPRRLWKRYMFGNPRFVVRFAAQVTRERMRKGLFERLRHA